MRLLAILNQKGGVGKTTTAANLGAALALRGRRVLLIDLDPQGNLTDHLGVEPAEDGLTVYDVLTEGALLTEAAVATGTAGLHLVPSHEDLAGVELELAGQPGRELRLRHAVERLGPDAYDYLLVDCPPSLGLLSLNAMAAVREVVVALQTEYFALRGMTQLQRILDLVRRKINPDVRLAGILATLVDPVTNLAREVTEEVRAHFGDLVFRTRIRKSVRLAEAPGHQRHIFAYAPDSTGAKDYRALAEEIEARAPGASPPGAGPPAPMAAAAAPPARPAEEQPKAIAPRVEPPKPAPKPTPAPRAITPAPAPAKALTPAAPPKAPATPAPAKPPTSAPVPRKATEAGARPAAPVRPPAVPPAVPPLRSSAPPPPAPSPRPPPAAKPPPAAGPTPRPATPSARPSATPPAPPPNGAPRGPGTKPK